MEEKWKVNGKGRGSKERIKEICKDKKTERGIYFQA
jgi:hypothetical protein